MKKEITYSIFVTLLLVLITIAGSTYAYYSFVATGNNTNISVGSEKYAIVYNGTRYINSTNCQMNIVATKEQGCNTTIEIGLDQGVNVAVNANFFVEITSISEDLKSAAFKWEVYRINGAQEEFVSRGNFANVPANNIIQIASNQALSTTLAEYKIYFWIDGALSGNEVAGTSFSGKITASTDMLTGIVNNN